MASLQSKIGIWNAAVDLLKEAPIDNVTDDRPMAKWLSRNYDQKRDYLLERLNWKFAMKRAAIAASTEVPAWGWSYRYPLPDDCLKVIPPTYDGTFMGKPIPYEIESDVNGRTAIMTDVQAPLRIRYIRRVTVEGQFSNGFCELFAARLAAEMCHWVSGKASLLDLMLKREREIMNDVKSTEAFVLSGGEYYDSDIVEMHERAW